LKRGTKLQQVQHRPEELVGRCQVFMLILHDGNIVPQCRETAAHENMSMMAVGIQQLSLIWICNRNMQRHTNILLAMLG